MSLLKYDDLDPRPMQWLVQGMVPRAGIGIVYGKSGIGKSFLTNSELALAIANGVPFFGRETLKGNVMICLGEGEGDARERVAARITRERRDRENTATDMDDDGKDGAFWLSTQPPYDGRKIRFWADRFALPVIRSRGGTSDKSDEMKNFIEEVKSDAEFAADLELVILDTLSDYSGGLSISNDTSANRIMLGMKELSQALNCCVLVVAHPDKAGNDLMGAGRLRNSADFIIRVQSGAQREDSDMPPTVAVICDKMKFGQMFDSVQYVLNQETWTETEFDDDGNATDGTVVKSSATVKRHDREPRRLGTGETEEMVISDPNKTKPRKRAGIDGSNMPGLQEAQKADRAEQDRAAGILEQMFSEQDTWNAREATLRLEQAGIPVRGKRSQAMKRARDELGVRTEQKYDATRRLNYWIWTTAA